MKILILTHPLEANYGGVLQNFALQSFLKSLGHEVTTIDAHNDKTPVYKVLSFIYRLILNRLLGKRNIPIKFAIHESGKSIRTKNPEISRFIRDNILTTEYVKSYNRLKPILLKYRPDAIVVGSDQVWLKQYYPHTFLDFALKSNIIKISYAASGDISWIYDFQDLSKCQNYVSQFDAISVREKSMVGLCDALLLTNATWVLDPIFLLNRSVYQKFVNASLQKQSPLLTTYILDETADKRNLICELSQRHRLVIEDSLHKERGVSSIEGWVTSIYYSELVVTDSFHGMVLSVIFNKPFIAIANRKRGIDRFISLLGTIGLEDRLIYEDALDVDYIDKLHPIDYTYVNQLIDYERERSISFLTSNLAI